jgi:sulfate permease, SulP family
MDRSQHFLKVCSLPRAFLPGYVTIFRMSNIFPIFLQIRHLENIIWTRQQKLTRRFFVAAPWSDWPGMIFREFIDNWRSGLTVALVSVPLSISLALAAGGTPVMGIITAIWAGISTAIFGGSQFNINGPAGALSGILSVYAVGYGVGVLPLLAVLAGFVIFAIMLLRFDIYVMFIPSAVMEGFSFAVAIIIGANQLRMGFGLPAEVPVRAEFIFNLWETITHLHWLDPLSTGTFLVGFALLWYLVTKAPKIPWGVILAAIAIAIGYATANGHMVMFKNVKTLQTRYGELNPEVFNFQIPSFPGPKSPSQSQTEVYWDVIYGAFSVAFVATMSHLINARVAERLTNIKYAQAREVFSGAIANFLCGIFGGVPATAALARTTLNIKTGATSRASGIISAISVCLISLVFLNWFKYLLLPAVASILMVTAVRMVELKHLMHMYRFDRKMFWVTIFTAVVCVARDLTDGIIAGGIVSLFIYAKANSKAYGEVSSAIAKEKRITATRSAQSIDEEAAAKERERVRKNYRKIGSIVTAGLTGGADGNKPADEQAGEDESELDLESAKFHGDTLIYKFPSELTYLNSPAHIERAKQLHTNFAYVILDMRSLYYMDVDGSNALNEIVDEFDRFDKLTLVSSVRPDMEEQLSISAWYTTKKSKGLVLHSDAACLHYIHDYEMTLDDQGDGIPLDDDELPLEAVGAFRSAFAPVDDTITSSPTFIVSNLKTTLSKTLPKGKEKESEVAPSSSSSSAPAPAAAPVAAKVESPKKEEQPKPPVAVAKEEPKKEEVPAVVTPTTVEDIEDEHVPAVPEHVPAAVIAIVDAPAETPVTLDDDEDKEIV